MERQEVQSRNIKSVGYDADTQTLEVEFHHGGRVYSYSGVSEDQYHSLVNARSPGAHLQSHIAGRPEHPHTKVR
jgi:hypothetical protein